MPMSERIVVAMSGGVDSSVAAALLCEQGFEVVGVTLQLWGKDVCVSSGTRLCCSVRDALDAKAVTKRLGIRHETLELVDDFRDHVIDYFVDSYREGLTPNPCIACNTHIKFGTLMERAETFGASRIATGHYARAGYDEVTARYTLQRAVAETKDHAHVLFELTQPQLGRVVFPLGELTKVRVRELARSLGFETAEKPDSQDVCFVRDRNKNGFLRRELQVIETPGPITNRSGQVLGTHQGLLGYTIGQREGLGLSIGTPLYVLALDQSHNRLVVGSRDELLQGTLIAERMNWVSSPPLTASVRATAKIRSRHEGALASVIPLTDNQVRVEFDEPQPAITPGQAVVLYDGDVVLGGGWIARHG